MPPSLQSQYRQQFIPPLPDYNRTREISASSSTSGSASSIWAPQPQSPSVTWPSNSLAYEELTQQELNHSPLNVYPIDERPVTREEVFGSIGVASPPVRREVGAIGDGRQRGLSLDETVRFLAFSNCSCMRIQARS
jgi:hypothetical protein